LLMGLSLLLFSQKRGQHYGRPRVRWFTCHLLPLAVCGGKAETSPFVSFAFACTIWASLSKPAL